MNHSIICHDCRHQPSAAEQPIYSEAISFSSSMLECSLVTVVFSSGRGKIDVLASLVDDDGFDVTKRLSVSDDTGLTGV